MSLISTSPSRRAQGSMMSSASASASASAFSNHRFRGSTAMRSTTMHSTQKYNKEGEEEVLADWIHDWAAMLPWTVCLLFDTVQ